jgi:hypothetical protein
MYTVIIISLPATTASPEQGLPLACPSARVEPDGGSVLEAIARMTGGVICYESH